MELGLGGKVAIVTGGSKGIGRATAIRFAEEGAAVLVCARGSDALQETVALAGKTAGARVEAMQADLTKADDLKRVAARCVEAFGKIDILVNNAGSARPGDFQTLTDDEWLEDWTLKFFGIRRRNRPRSVRLRCARAGAPTRAWALRLTQFRMGRPRQASHC